MKKLLIIFIAAISTSLFVGCDYDEFTPPNYLSFEATGLDFSVNETATDSYEVTVYTANVAGNDRTFSINVEETSTLDPGAYTIPSSVTIPANSNEATFTVEVTGAGIDNAGDTLVLSLGQQEGLFTGNNLTLNLKKICAFDVTGSYENTSVVLGGATNPTIRPVQIIAGAVENQYIAKDLYEDGKDVTFTVDPATNAITLATQPGFTHPVYGAATVTGLAGSQVEPCLNQITLVIRISVAAGNFGARTDVLERTGDVSEGEETDGGDTDEGEEDGSEDGGDDSGDDS